MKKLLSCREVWCYEDCDYIVAEESEEEVVRTAAEHGIKEHGKTKKDMVKSIDKLKEFIYTIN
jgi:predicted small metal-binding protein